MTIYNLILFTSHFVQCKLQLFINLINKPRSIFLYIPVLLFQLLKIEIRTLTPYILKYNSMKIVQNHLDTFPSISESEIF